MDELTTSQKDGSGVDRNGVNLTGMDEEGVDAEAEATTTTGGVDVEEEEMDDVGRRSGSDVATGGEFDEFDDDDAILFDDVCGLLQYFFLLDVE